MKTTTYREDGTVEIVDARTEMACLEQAISRILAGCEAEILDDAPEHSQRNAALGILDADDVARIVAAISTRRARCRSLIDEAKVLAWSGRPREETCDALDMMRWR